MTIVFKKTVMLLCGQECDEYADMNYALHRMDLGDFPEKGQRIERVGGGVFHTVTPTMFTYSGREIRLLLLADKDGKVHRQPVYRSTGNGTSITTKGMWYPFSGIWGDDVINVIYPDDRRLPDGWIGKHFLSLEGSWVSHYKEEKDFPSALWHYLKNIK